jgi:hypothetical protein
MRDAGDRPGPMEELCLSDRGPEQLQAANDRNRTKYRRRI